MLLLGLTGDRPLELSRVVCVCLSLHCLHTGPLSRGIEWGHCVRRGRGSLETWDWLMSVWGAVLGARAHWGPFRGVGRGPMSQCGETGSLESQPDWAGAMMWVSRSQLPAELSFILAALGLPKRTV